jgi:hypothetical protein
MTPAAFRDLALKLPGAVESAHVGHPDFRMGGKIFATLSPDGAWGMVKLTPEQQGVFVRAQPGVFEAFDNAWGRMGCTKVHLKGATKGALEPALVAAWENLAAGARKTRTGKGGAKEKKPRIRRISRMGSGRQKNTKDTKGTTG